jgi:hypothetical protein
MSVLDPEPLRRRFAAIGADLRVAPLPPRLAARRYTLDVEVDRRRRVERFVVALSEGVDVQVLHADRARRHLLLLVARPDGSGQPEKHRYLCGHDERHWFVAAVPSAPGGITTVERALEALKPEAVRQAQDRAGVKPRDRQQRSNRGYVRQGEWFFVPAPGLVVSASEVRRGEPLTRGGKPHRAELAVRRGGRTAYVCSRHPQGVTEAVYQRTIRRDRAARSWGWRVMRSDPEVYCQGRIRHPDHGTVVLRGWHRVLPNTESQAPWAPQMTFLD